MNQKPILQQALGDRWEYLAAPIKNHYQIQPYTYRIACFKILVWKQCSAWASCTLVRNTG